MSDPDFTHFIITRFNIRVSGFGPEKMVSPRMDDSYLRQRMHFFETYCAPSIHHQTVKDFTWILYLDPQTDSGVLDHIRNMTAGPIPVILAVADGYDDMVEDIRRRIRECPTSYCISTRLDNDDILSADYVAAVQHLFIRQDRTLINFTQGFEIDLNRHYIKKWNQRFTNQFTSLIESCLSPEILTIYGYSHNTLPKVIHVINEGNGARWAYTRHSLNYSRQKINARPVFSTSALASFPSLAGKVQIAFLPTCLYTLKWFFVRAKKKIKGRLMSYLQ